MMIKLKSKKALIVFFIVLTVFLSPVVLSQAGNPLDMTDEQLGLTIDCEFLSCGIPQIFQLANKVINFIIWIAITAFSLVIIYSGGILALNSLIETPAAALAKAKGKIKMSLIGLLIVLSAYLIVKFLFEIVGYKENPFSAPSSSSSTSSTGGGSGATRGGDFGDGLPGDGDPPYAGGSGATRSGDFGDGLRGDGGDGNPPYAGAPQATRGGDAGDGLRGQTFEEFLMEDRDRLNDFTDEDQRRWWKEIYQERRRDVLRSLNNPGPKTKFTYSGVTGEEGRQLYIDNFDEGYGGLEQDDAGLWRLKDLNPDNFDTDDSYRKAYYEALGIHPPRKVQEM